MTEITTAAVAEAVALAEAEANQSIILSNGLSAKINLKERVEWALTKPAKVEKKEGITKGKQEEDLQKEEKKWGNSMIGQQNNGQWTTLLGERLVRDILELRGENPRKPARKGGFQPDWETDEYIYEVKTFISNQNEEGEGLRDFFCF